MDFVTKVVSSIELTINVVLKNIELMKLQVSIVFLYFLRAHRSSYKPLLLTNKDVCACNNASFKKKQG